MSIAATPKRTPKMAPKKRAFLLSQDLLQESDREHLSGSLFPLILELKQKVRKHAPFEK